MDTGFNYYYGADPGSTTSSSRTRRVGSTACASSARAAPRRSSGRPIRSSSSRCRSRRSTTSSSTATATSSGESGCASSSASRRVACRRSTSRSAGEDFRGDTGRARTVRRDPVQRVRPRDLGGAHRTQHHAPRARDGAGVVDRRPFELPRCGAAIVSNPHDGIETWFEPGRELLVVEAADDATAAYRELLGDPGAGRGARRSRARASARRAHVRAPCAAAARAVGLGVRETVA